MRIRLVWAVLALVFGVSGASAIDYFSVTGTVKDKVTDAGLTAGHYRILNTGDSTLVKEGNAFSRWMSGSSDNYNVTIDPTFSVRDLDRSKKYILELTHDRYEPFFIDIDPSTMKKKADVMNLGVLRMTKAKMLSELTVTATKVKFYNKGDTIVYNADAFVLAEGSMLDALIAQLPGAELKPNGQIFVNGRFVENLLLNGKDFFKGNNSVMLENLGAYTVKNIAVYDGQDEMDRIMGKEFGKKKLTMDVRLKKEYMNGFILNGEAGYGTESRFLGQLFGMYYNDLTRISFFGNANNLSDTWNPSQYSSGFQMKEPQSGEVDTYSGGVDYNTRVAHSPLSFEGNAEANYQVRKDKKSVYTTNFLPEGDTYGYSFSDSRLRNLALKTSHTMKVMEEKWNLQFTPKFNYVRNDDNSSLTQAAFSREWDDVDRDFIDAIFSNSTAGVLESLINRNLNERSRYGHTMTADAFSNGKFKLPNETDALSYLLSYTYGRKHYNDRERYLLNFGSDRTSAQYADRHYANHPDYNWRAKGAFGYVWNVSRGLFLDMYYTYQRYHSRSVSDLYSAENYNEASGGGLIAGLPSATEHYMELDPDNSFDSRYREESHQLNLDLNWELPKAGVHIWMSIPFQLRRQWLDYTRGDIFANLHRDKFFLGNLSGSINISKQSLGWIYIGLDRSVMSPDMVDMVDFTNSLDPLNIRRGNSGLKDMATDNISVYYDKTLSQAKQMKHHYGVEFTVIENALAYGYTYDKASGVKTGSMYNVSGNWNLNLSQSFGLQFGPLNRFELSQRTAYLHARSADLIGTEQGGLEKNIVNSNSISEDVSLAYTFGKSRIAANFNGSWNRYTSGQAEFQPFNAWNLKYGVTGNFTLPANFSIQTSFNVFSRRGYSDPSLNKDNFVWNARISYSLLKGQLLLMADGYDILHNLTNVFYTVNAQARTETYANTLPRYFMFHIQWKFNKLPKNKRK